MARILYIEDDFNNRVLVRRILMAEGYDVEEADNAMTGIEIAANDPPDLILMDINMPGMDGLTATVELRNMPQLDHVPIVALTANVIQADEERTLNAGCNGYIRKPIDVDSFTEQINQYLK